MTLPYGSTVLEHFRRPRNQGRLEQPSVSREGYNPLCGDRVRIDLDIVGTEIRSAAFTANACAICTASASLLTERVSGRPIEAARAIADSDVVGSLGEGIPAGRVSCATLPLRTLKDALAEFGARA